MTTPLVRLAAEADFPAICELARLHCEASSPPLAFSMGNTRAAFDEYLATATPSIFVVERDRKVVAAAAATIEGYPYADGIFTSLALLVEHQDEPQDSEAGFLIAHLVEWSRRLGALAIVGLEDHRATRAANLRRAGFRPCGALLTMELRHG